jgi:hypothetical protein
MAKQKINTVAGNTAPPIVLTCERNGVAIDVTGCTVSLVIAQGNTVTNTNHQTCDLTTPTSGVVTYTPQTGDIPNPSTYTCDLKIVYGDGSIEILYDQLQLKARKALGT